MIVMDLTDREIELLMGAVGTNIETIKRRHNPADAMIAELIEELFELETDLREALHRQDDGWADPEDPDLHMDPVDFAAKHDKEAEVFMVAEDDFIRQGMDAREQAKANSRAAGRRALNFRGSRDKDEKSEMQKHDVFDCDWNPDDPKNW